MLIVLEMEQSSLIHFELHNITIRLKQTANYERILHVPTLQASGHTDALWLTPMNSTMRSVLISDPEGVANFAQLPFVASELLNLVFHVRLCNKHENWQFITVIDVYVSVPLCIAPDCFSTRSENSKIIRPRPRWRPRWTRNLPTWNIACC